MDRCYDRLLEMQEKNLPFREAFFEQNRSFLMRGMGSPEGGTGCIQGGEAGQPLSYKVCRLISRANSQARSQLPAVSVTSGYASSSAIYSDATAYNQRFPFQRRLIMDFDVGEKGVHINMDDDLIHAGGPPSLLLLQPDYDTINSIGRQEEVQG